MPIQHSLTSDSEIHTDNNSYALVVSKYSTKITDVKASWITGALASVVVAASPTLLSRPDGLG